MTDFAPARHPGIYLLGDHLDAALAMGEDMLTEKVALADAAEQLTTARLVRQNRELSEFLTVTTWVTRPPASGTRSTAQATGSRPRTGVAGRTSQ